MYEKMEDFVDWLQDIGESTKSLVGWIVVIVTAPLWIPFFLIEERLFWLRVKEIEKQKKEVE